MSASNRCRTGGHPMANNPPRPAAMELRQSSLVTASPLSGAASAATFEVELVEDDPSFVEVDDAPPADPTAPELSKTKTKTKTTKLHWGL